MEPFPPPHTYMRPPPPPPPMADPHHLSHHQPPPPPQSQRPLPPPHASWYSPQFQYQAPHSHSPSPPPPHPPPPPPLQQQWPPPPPSDHLNAPVPYANPPYPSHPPYPSQFPPPQRPPMPPPQAYPNANQDWGNVNWAQHSGWEYQGHNNGEDWGAKARAWAAARNAMENQHSVQSHYPSQYLPPSDSQYHDSEQTNMHASSYLNYPLPVAPMDKQTVHQPQTATVSSVHPYYAPDGNFSYAAKDGNFSDVGATFPQQDGFVNPSVHKQEVPSSYSSIPGRQDSKEEQQQTSSGGGDSMFADQTQFSYGNHSVPASTDPCDQPLQFTPRFNHENNPKMPAGYSDPIEPARGMDSVPALPTLQPWTTSAATSISFPSVPPTFPSAAQLDPTISMPPLAGQPSPMLGRAPGPSFHSTVSSLPSPVGLGTGISVHPATTFPGDVYGAPMNTERPKKSAVPSWLRDEIIKKKDIIASSGQAQVKDEAQSTDDEAVDKSVGKSDQADSKSIDSSRSTEEEEDEDYEEAIRTAAINQEIKRVLTEVLLKVTSDLFDEIATRVLSEDDHSIEAKNDANAPSQKLSSPPAASASKVYEKVQIPVKTKEPKSEDVSEKSSSGAAGNVLGLVNYASDDDADEEEIRSSIVPKSDRSSNIVISSSKNLKEGMNDVVENGHSPPDSEKLNKKDLARSSHSAATPRGTVEDHASQFVDLPDHKSGKKLDNNDVVGPPYSTSPVEKEVDTITDGGRVTNSFDDSRANNFSRKVTDNKPEAPPELVRKVRKDDSREKDNRRHDRHESRSSSARDSAKELENVEEREISKGEKNHSRHDERHQRKKSEDHNDPKERSKEQGVKYGEKTKEVDSRKRSSHHQAKESAKEVERLKKVSDKDDVHRKRERSKDEKGDRSKHKYSSDKGRHKRRRSSSLDSRGRNSKDNSVSYSDNSTDEASENSRRKTHSKRRNLSPSPVRSRRRQVSRSPPSSKVSQRKHSPYSSLDHSRGRRSRSRSPARRR